MNTMTAETLLRDIFDAEAALHWFEQKYGLLSETFYQVYQQGLLRDEDPDEIQEYLSWAGSWEIFMDRRQRYNQAIELRRSQLNRPASLLELHFNQLRVPV